ncbi:unnamed protein product, partial [Closterium sp. NIES-64]
METARGEAGAGGSGPNRQGEEGQVEAQGALDLEKKLQEFLQGLESAGYYAGTVVGSEEYVTRQQQARGSPPSRNHAPTHPILPTPILIHSPAGNAAMAAHNYDEALSLYSKAIALCVLSLYSKAIPLCVGTTNAIYYANRGCFKDFSFAVLLFADCRAAAQHQLGNYMEAAADSRRAVAVDPRYSKAYSGWGMRAWRWVGTTRRLKRALRKVRVLVGVGIAGVGLQERSLELDPSNAAHKENLK